MESLKKSYPSAAARISGQVCDLGDEASIEANIVKLLDSCGELDHIIYTAGDKLASMELSSASFASMRQAGLVRFYGPLLVGKYAKKYLSAGPRSSLTLTTGAVSERPIADWTVVNSYATGLQGMTRGLALDLKPIRVNLVSPGAVQTELWSTVGLSSEQQKAMFEGYSKTQPTGHVALPEEIAETYLYLLKDTNITGSMISTNGGTLLLGPH